LKRRDRVVVAVANFVLRFASKRYRALVRGLIAKGFETAIAEARKAETK